MNPSSSSSPGSSEERKCADSLGRAVTGTPLTRTYAEGVFWSGRWEWWGVGGREMKYCEDVREKVEGEG